VVVIFVGKRCPKLGHMAFEVVRGVVTSAAAAAGGVASLLAFGAMTTRIPCGPAGQSRGLWVFRDLRSACWLLPRLGWYVGEFLPETSSVSRPLWSGLAAAHPV
jgi:hypothetical protein